MTRERKVTDLRAVDFVDGDILAATPPGSVYEANSPLAALRGMPTRFNGQVRTAASDELDAAEATLAQLEGELEALSGNRWDAFDQLDPEQLATLDQRALVLPRAVTAARLKVLRLRADHLDEVRERVRTMAAPILELREGTVARLRDAESEMHHLQEMIDGFLGHMTGLAIEAGEARGDAHRLEQQLMPRVRNVIRRRFRPVSE